MFVLKRTGWPLVVTFVTLLGAAGSAAAQSAPPADDDDPPDRIGRLSYLQTPVSFQPAGADEWAIAEPNRPLTTGDRIWADSTGRAEVDAGSAILRLATFTELDLVRLDDHWLQVRLPQGTIAERLKVLGDDQDNEVDTPNAAVALLQSGRYRIDVSGDGATTTVTVWSGRAQVTAAGSSFNVESGQAATIRGDNTLSYDPAGVGAPDDFDRWSESRDVREDAATTARSYVSEDTPGEEDLDAYGRWETDVSYGPVWYPTTIEAGWAPYREGHWVWISPWGWTWVDAAPWGFTPYHYGRWAFVRGRWGWCPGRRIVAPVYAPALVVFVGDPGWRTSPAFVGGGGVAWFPLAPGEVYYPTYVVDAGYRRRVNIATVTNVTYINNITRVTTVTYRNRAVAGAVTAVPQRVFVGAQPVSRSVVQLAPQDIQGARVVGMAPAVVPSRTSLAVSVPDRRPAVPPQRLATRPVSATHAPPPAAVPFAAQERAITSNGGRPPTPTQIRSITSGPAAPNQPTWTFRSAGAPAPSGRPLAKSAAPARMHAPSRATEQPAPAAGQRAPEQPAPRAPTAAAARSAAPQPQAAAPQPRPVPRPPASSLQRSYQNERAAVEARHRQEFAKPNEGETPDDLSRRQDAEDRALEERYNQARTRNLRTMPPAQSQEKPNPQPHPAQRAQPAREQQEPRAQPEGQQPQQRQERNPRQRTPQSQ
jgi:hypothetical protein